jgi:DMSO/TMAO reductase YedYZ molybdopterin-dependent catalytic subunit
MQTKVRGWFLVAGLLIILTAGVLAGCAPKVDWDLTVTSGGSTALVLSHSDLAGMEQVELNDILMERSEGEDTIESWSGVPLTAILEKAGANTDPDLIVALAADGYAVEIPRDELVDGIVALKHNGEWLLKDDPDQGPIRFVFPKTPANRWVFQLKEIQVP